MSTVRLTMAQALVHYLENQYTEIDGDELPLFAGVFAIFGHGNVSGLGEALWQVRERFPTLRAHNEQAMTHAAVAYAKASDRRRMMACTTSIGPGATNLVTAAALAHVNRLPVLLLPGDVFASRAPDPVLQQLEDFGDPSRTVNDSLRPVSRYWDRIVRPEQLLRSLPAAISTLLDAADCGPVTLALPQDVQAEQYDYPEEFFRPQVHRPRRPEPDRAELADAVETLRRAERPLLVAGGGVHYAGAREVLADFAARHGLPVAETQAGKGVLAHDHPGAVGALGVTGSDVANRLAAEADVILAVGTRLADFPTASRSVFRNPDRTLIGLNAQRFDAAKHAGQALVCDARVGLERLGVALGGWKAPASWTQAAREGWNTWATVVERATTAVPDELPSDAQVIGAVNRFSRVDSVVVCAAGGLPGELHKLWRVKSPGSYHLEYGFSCMGYEIAGGLGVKLARPECEVIVMVGDGSYLMLNSEIATSVMLDQKLIIVVLDNRGFACINRLQQACGGAPFNNLLRDARHGGLGIPDIDFVAHAAALGALAEKVKGIASLDSALERARAADRTYVLVLDTDPLPSTIEGGAWWDVPVPEHSERREVVEAHENYIAHKRDQWPGA